MTFELLSTRELDLEDASSVLRSLASSLDRELLEPEIDTLARSLASHPVRERWEQIRSTT